MHRPQSGSGSTVSFYEWLLAGRRPGCLAALLILRIRLCSYTSTAGVYFIHMTYLYTLLSLVLLDSIWLTLMGGFYKHWFSLAFTPSFELSFAVICFYPLYAFGVWVFVLRPALAMKKKWHQVLLTGALFGLIAYSAYDLSNQATIQGWSWMVTVVDMAWGACITGLASLIAWKLTKK